MHIEDIAHIAQLMDVNNQRLNSSEQDVLEYTERAKDLISRLNEIING